MEKFVAIITARGGSKRIPRKNIKNFIDKPIMAYSIIAALESGIFDEVMVSTDDLEIAEVAKQYGAVVPFMRSKENSDDFSDTNDVLKEVIKVYESQGRKFEYMCCIYPCAPFVTPEKIKKALKLLEETDADSVIPVAEYNYPVWRSYHLDENSKVTFNWPEYAPKRSQDIPPVYHDCGQYYCMRVENFMQKGRIQTDNTIGIVTSSLEVQDIDNEDDWRLAELKYSFLQNRK